MNSIMLKDFSSTSLYQSLFYQVLLLMHAKLFLRNVYHKDSEVKIYRNAEGDV